jgi:hypothetical protein
MMKGVLHHMDDNSARITVAMTEKVLKALLEIPRPFIVAICRKDGALHQPIQT